MPTLRRVRSISSTSASTCRNSHAGLIAGAGSLPRTLGSRIGATEAAKEFLKRVGLGANRDALLGGDVDHRRLEPGGKVGERHWRSGARHHRRRRVLRDLGTGFPGGERESGSSNQQGGGHSISVTQGSVLLRNHKFSRSMLTLMDDGRSSA